jgi:hypothetical protein
VPELTNTIMRDLPRLRDTEAISRDTGNAHLTKSSDNCNLNQTSDLPHLICAMRPYPPTPLNNNTGTTRITVREKRILKRLAPDGCNTLTRRPQKRRRALL